jgi:general secretion pathway protein D
MKEHTTKYRNLTILAGLCLALAASAQTRTPGGFSGGGGFGGGGGATPSTRTSSGSTARQYPSAGTIGGAYFSIDPETRRVVTIADEETMNYISQVLSNLDRPKPQVLIKVVFLELTYNNALDIGLEGGWAKDIGGGNSANAANVFGLGALNSVTTNLQFNTIGQQANQQPISSFLPSSPITANGAGLYQLMGQNYQVTLRAIAQAGKAKVLSRPSILARNNQPATIVVGQEYPTVGSVSYPTTLSGPISSIIYKEVGVILKVTPFITPDGMVEMIVSPQISAIDPTTSVQISSGIFANAINTRSADTVTVTPDGQTVIIGGLIQDAKSKNETKIPFLGDIPVLGNLFKRQQRSDSKTELIIFLTPHIIPNPTQLAALTDAERAKMDPLKSFSEEELNRFLNDLPHKTPAKR